MFKPLLDHFAPLNDQRTARDKSSTINLVKAPQLPEDNDSLKEQITQVGARVKVKWNAEKIGDLGWKRGWYTANVQGYDYDEDITVQYLSEPGCTYTMEVIPLLELVKLNLFKLSYNNCQLSCLLLLL